MTRSFENDWEAGEKRGVAKKIVEIRCSPINSSVQSSQNSVSDHVASRFDAWARDTGRSYADPVIDGPSGGGIELTVEEARQGAREWDNCNAEGKRNLEPAPLSSSAAAAASDALSGAESLYRTMRLLNETLRSDLARSPRRASPRALDSRVSDNGGSSLLTRHQVHPADAVPPPSEESRDVASEAPRGLGPVLQIVAEGEARQELDRDGHEGRPPPSPSLLSPGSSAGAPHRRRHVPVTSGGLSPGRGGPSPWTGDKKEGGGRGCPRASEADSPGLLSQGAVGAAALLMAEVSDTASASSSEVEHLDRVRREERGALRISQWFLMDRRAEEGEEAEEEALGASRDESARLVDALSAQRTPLSEALAGRPASCSEEPGTAAHVVVAGSDADEATIRAALRIRFGEIFYAGANTDCILSVVDCSEIRNIDTFVGIFGSKILFSRDNLSELMTAGVASDGISDGYNATFYNSLRQLFVTDCRRLSRISCGVLNMFSNLVHLSLRGCGLRELFGNDGLTLPQLKRLDLSRNSLKTLDKLQCLQSLTSLDASFNDIESMHRGPHMLLPLAANLLALNLLSNPVSRLVTYAGDVASILPNLEVFDGRCVKVATEELQSYRRRFEAKRRSWRGPPRRPHSASPLRPTQAGSRPQSALEDYLKRHYARKQAKSEQDSKSEASVSLRGLKSKGNS
jgi:hypothetical protein